LLEERAAEMVAVGKDAILLGQESPAAIDEVEAGQAVLERDLLSAQVLLDRLVEERAALHGGVVGDHHARHARDRADPGDDPGRRDLVAVELPGGEGREFEEGRERVEEVVDALADRPARPGRCSR
jgi:hypothetical protein